jgi:hypothetical protein
MKLWADRFPFTGEVKGSAVIIEPGQFVLIVTSNYPIEKCFTNQEDVDALRRRFNEIHMTKANAAMVNAWKLQWEILLDGEEAQEEINWEEKVLEGIVCEDDKLGDHPTREELEAERRRQEKELDGWAWDRDRGGWFKNGEEW